MNKIISIAVWQLMSSYIGPFHFLSMDGAQVWKKIHGRSYHRKIQLDFQHLPYPYGWSSCLKHKIPIFSGPLRPIVTSFTCRCHAPRLSQILKGAVVA